MNDFFKSFIGRVVLALAVSFCTITLLKGNVTASETKIDSEFSFTDVYGESQKFSGVSDKMKVVIFGGIGSCYTTQSTMELLDAVLEGIKDDSVEIYAFDIAGNLNENIVEYLSDFKHNERIIAGGSSDAAVCLFAYKYVFSIPTGFNMPYVMVLDKDGTILGLFNGSEGQQKILSTLEKYGVEIDRVAGNKSINTTVRMVFEYGQSQAREQLAMINEFRTGSDAWAWDKSGNKLIADDLQELVYDYDLEKVAMLRAVEIAYSYSHTRPNGLSCFSASDGIYSCSVMGENIAYGFKDSKSVFIAWREDDEDYSGQGHRRNMLGDEFTTFAVGHVKYNGLDYWVQLFGNKVQNTSATTPCDGLESMNIETTSRIARNNYYKMNKSDSFTDGNACDHIWLMVEKKIKSSNASFCEVSGKARCLKCDIYTRLSFSGNHWCKFVTIKPANICGDEEEIFTYCIYCDYEKTYTRTSSSEHTFLEGVVTKEPTETTTGIKEYSCISCTYVKKEVIPATKTKIKSVSLSFSGAEYTGKSITPTVSVKDEDGKTVKSKYYTVKYSANKNVGKATVTVTAKGKYIGTIKATFTIKPSKTSVTKTKAGSKKFTVYWSKKTAQADGYQVQYSTASNFKKAETVTIKGNGYSSKTITKLKGKTVYYVRVRTYKKVGNKTYYSPWSTSKKVTTGK